MVGKGNEEGTRIGKLHERDSGLAAWQVPNRVWADHSKSFVACIPSVRILCRGDLANATQLCEAFWAYGSLLFLGASGRR